MTARTLATLPGHVRVSHVLSVSAALVTVAAARATMSALTAALAGSLLLLAGLNRRSERAVVLAGVVLFSAMVSVGASDGSLVTVLVGSFGAVLAADFGAFALGIVRDVDQSVATTRVELLHAVGSVTVGIFTGGLAYALFRSVPRGTTLSVVALLFAAVVLAFLLRD